MSLGSSHSIGLPGMWSTKRVQKTFTIEVNGKSHIIKTTNRTSIYSGFYYWIDGDTDKRYFCNLLTRPEVIESAKKKIIKMELNNV